MNTLDILEYCFNLESGDKPRASEGHHPSSARCVVKGKVYGSCLRKLWYTWKQTPYTDKVNQWSAQFGTAIHEWLEGKIKKHKLEILEHFGLKNIIVEEFKKHTIEGLTYPIRMRSDIIILPNDGDAFGCDLKTGYQKGTKDIQEYGCKDYWILQLGIYAYIYPDAKYFEVAYIDRGNFYRTRFNVYYLKDTDQIFSWSPITDKEVDYGFTFQGIVASWKELEKYLEDDKLPPRDFDPVLVEELLWRKEKEMDEDGVKYHYKTVQKMVVTKDCSWQCKYCQWRGECLKNG